MGVGVVGKGASLGGVSISGKEPACHSRRYGFNPWAGKSLCNKSFSAPNSQVLDCLASVCQGHRNLGSITKSGILRVRQCKAVRA